MLIKCTVTVEEQATVGTLVDVPLKLEALNGLPRS